MLVNANQLYQPTSSSQPHGFPLKRLDSAHKNWPNNDKCNQISSLKLCLPEGSEGLEVDGLQHMLRCIKLQQEHNEDSVVWKLLELCLSHIVILDQHTYHNAQNLKQDKKCSINQDFPKKKLTLSHKPL